MPSSDGHYASVAAIADELVANGITNPRYNDICDGLQSRGLSRTYVYKHLKTWRSRRDLLSMPSAETSRTATGPVESPSLRRMVERLVLVQKELIGAWAREDQLGEQLGSLEAQVREQKWQLSALTAERDCLQRKCTTLETEIARIREPYLEARCQAARLQYWAEKGPATIEAQRSELQELRIALLQEQSRNGIQQARLQGDNQGLSACLEKSRQREQELRSELVALQAKMGRSHYASLGSEAQSTSP